MGKKKQDSEDISIDVDEVLRYTKQYLPILLVLIPILFSYYVRTMPAELDIANEWARQGVYNGLRNQIRQQVRTQYPNLDEQSMNNLVNQQLNEFLQQQGGQLDQAISNQAQYFKERFRDDQGYTYLGDIDSYFWARYATNLLERGTYGDEVRDGVQWDNHMNAPVGLPASVNMYPYIEATLHRIFTTFAPELPIYVTAFYTPLVLSIFAIIAAFFIARRLAGNFAGFIAGMLIALNSTILSRSLGSDNDVVNAVFPLIIMLFILLAFDAKTSKKTLIYAALSGAFIGIYSFAWSGWWFMFLFIIAAVVIYLAYLFIYEIAEEGSSVDNLKSNPKVLNMMYMLGAFLIVSFISLALFGNADRFFNAFTNPLNIIALDQASRGSIWPNVYTTVAELNAANIPQIIGSLGGNVFFYLALIGTIFPILVFPKDKKVRKLNFAFLGFSMVYFALFIVVARAFAFSSATFVLTLAVLAVPIAYLLVTGLIEELKGIKLMLLIAFFAIYLLDLFYIFFTQLNIFQLMFLLSLPLGVGLLFSILFSYPVYPKHSILMLIWFMATIYAATKGVRFILLIVPAFAISFSTFLGSVVDRTAGWVGRAMDMTPLVMRGILILLILVVLFNPAAQGSQLSRAMATGYGYVPSVNDAWVETLNKIEAESQPDAIINSWWDFGHWFKFWADRAVTFDGASQNDQRAHWIGKVLLTDDEDQAKRILQMLDCGGDRAQFNLYQITGDQYASVQLVYDFLEMEEQEVREELLTMTSEEKTQEIIDYMFCEPPENFFITSQDMVGKSGVWAHFGIWNFERARIYNYFKDQNQNEFVASLVSELDYSEEQAQRLYLELNSFTTDRQINDWIAPWPSYAGQAGCQKQDNTTLICGLPNQGQQIPLTIDLEEYEAYIENGEQLAHPNSFGYFDGDTFQVKEYDENRIGYSVVLNGNSLLLVQEELVDSMFTRLFFLEGRGIDNFEKFHDVTDVGGNRIITWKVNW